MKRGNFVVIAAAVLLGLVLAGFGGWQYRQGEVDSYKQALVSEEKAKTEALRELNNTQDKLEIVESELADAKAELEDTYLRFSETRLKLETVEAELEAAQRQIDIREKFGIKISGEERNAPLGEKTGDHNYLSPDESALIFNVLSSLPQEVISSINSITVVYLPTPAGGGHYNEGGNIVIFDPPDMKGSYYTARVKFISSLYHEIGHAVYFSLLTKEEREKFAALYQQSRDESDFATYYGKNNVMEDFAEIFMAYSVNTNNLLKKAEKSPLLSAKLGFVSKFFDQYSYRLDDSGTISRWRDGKETVWPYQSRTNRYVEWILGY